MQKAARYYITRGFRPTYTPCLDEEWQDLLKHYKKSGDPDAADHLIESLDAARRHRWEELTSKINFTHSSRKSWALIRRLGAAQQPPKSTHPSISANAVAAHLIQVGKAPHDKKFKRQDRMQGRTLLQQMSDMRLPHTFTEERFQLLCRRRNQRQPQVTTISTSNSWRTWAPKLAPACPNSSPESWLPIPSHCSPHRPVLLCGHWLHRDGDSCVL